MEKKSFEISENDLVQKLVVDENEIQEPIVVEEEDVVEQEVTSPEFVQACKDSVRTAPKVSVDSISSLKRAIAYYDNLEDKIEAGVVADAEENDLSLDSLKTLDEVCEQIDTVRAQLAVCADRIGIIKQASKAARFVYTVDPFLFAIARLCVNAKVANGKNIEDVYNKCKEIYSLDERETLSIQQILRDMGYPIRGSFVADHESFDMIKQYFG